MTKDVDRNASATVQPGDIEKRNVQGWHSD